MTSAHPDLHLAASPDFFDTPRRAAPAGRFEALPDVTPPAGWARRERGLWDCYDPPVTDVPVTGWKVHVSAGPATARAVHDVVVPYCFARGLAFKRLASVEVVHLVSSKYGPRTTSGKLFTLYPRDAAEAVAVCRELHPDLAAYPGPRVLTDVPWRGGPLHLRFGAVRGRPYVDGHGRPGVLLRDEDGAWVPDPRTIGDPNGGAQALPDGFETAPPPASTGSALAHLSRFTGLHRSNGGGVYQAWWDEQRRWVVLKEAMPHTGYDRAGRSAVERLRAEAAALRRLDGVDGVPRVLDYLEVQGHELLVEEHLPGRTGPHWAGTHNPLASHSDPEPAMLRRYAARVDVVVRSVAGILWDVHARGLAVDDLHPGNLLVDEADHARVVDLETATALDEQAPGTFGGAGFGGARRTGRERDERALDMLALWFLLPLTRVAERDPYLLREHVDWAFDAYGPLPAALDARLAALRADAPRRLAPAPPVAGPALVAGMRAVATPERTDRLHPAGPEGFAYGGTCLAHGAAGTLWAMAGVGLPPTDQEREWFARRALAAPCPYRGLYVGDAGVAAVAVDLGAEPDLLAQLGRRLLDEPADGGRNLSVWAGVAGDVLGQLRTGTALGDDELVDAALAGATRCAEQLVQGRELPRAGYLHGWTGVAHAFLEVYRATRDAVWLGRAVDALQRDLARCEVDPAAGVRLASGGVRRTAYVGTGSGGIALVADEILDHADVPGLQELLPRLVQACVRRSVAGAGLLAGRAGLLAVVSRLRPRLPDQGHVDRARASAAVATHLDMLALQIVVRDEHRAVLDGNGLRFSCDLADGSAGVAVAVEQATRGGAVLPFLSHRPPAPSGVQVPDGASRRVPWSARATGGRNTS